MAEELQGLQDALVAAENAFAAQLVERRANRLVMTKAEFRAYNEATRTEQVDISREVSEATKALQDFLNAGREEAAAQVISVGTLHEGNRIKGASPDG